jgi:alpha-L-rhamnosidase
LLELSKSGHSDTAYRLLLQTSYPSWGYMVSRGATTMWERWNGDRMTTDPSMNSYNHYAYGAVGEWLYRYAAGIDEDAQEPGFHGVVLHPQFDAGLGEASATYDSPHGVIKSAWTTKGKMVTWKVVVPANTSAAVELPGDASIMEGGKAMEQTSGISFVRRESGNAVYEAVAGTYEFTIRLK